jgi:hypothetical protein
MPRPSRYLASIAFLLISFTSTRAAEPIMFGGHGDIDACSPAREVKGPPYNTPFARLHVGPSDKDHIIAKLTAGQYLFVCEDQGDWLGVVVVGTNTDRATCGITGPFAIRSVYTGPCKSGWVKRTFTDTPDGWGTAG